MIHKKQRVADDVRWPVHCLWHPISTAQSSDEAGGVIEIILTSPNPNPNPNPTLTLTLTLT